MICEVKYSRPTTFKILEIGVEFTILYKSNEFKTKNRALLVLKIICSLKYVMRSIIVGRQS